MPIGTGLAAQIGMAEEVYTNEVQRISGTPSGVFGVSFDGALTITTLATNASAAAIQAALEALPNIGTGGVTASGGPLPTAVDVTFVGPLVKQRNVPQMAVQGAVTGLTFSTLTPGTGYGDAVTVTRFLEFTNETLKLDIGRIESAGLRSGNRVQRTDRWTSNRKGAGGDIELEVPSKGIGMLLKHILGTVAITTPTNGVLTRKHSHTLADPAGKSLTIQISRPDTGGTVRPFTYKGCKVTDWELSNDLDALLMLKATVDAQDEDTSIGLAAASFASAFEEFTFVGGQITLAAANYDITKFSLTGKAGLKTDRYFIRSNSLKKEPLLSEMADLTGQLDADFTDLSGYTRFTAGSLAAVTATWTGSQIENVASPGPYFYKLQVTLPNVRFDGETPNVGGPDIVPQNLPFKVLSDGVAEPIQIDLYTTDTAS